MTVQCFLFPGQGSQKLGMGKSFHEVDELVEALFDEASDIAGFDVADLCFNGPFEKLTETRYLQPALATVMLGCLTAMEEFDVIPNNVAGHSLGEYVALVSARVISRRECLKLVTERGKLMQREAEAHPGTMSAVLRVAEAELQSIIDQVAGEDVIIANYNTPEQLVISGSIAGVEKVEGALKEKGMRFIRLAVSGAWHSRLMKGAEEEFNAIIDEIDFDDARIPIMMNVTGMPETEGAAIKELMKRQMCSGVRWYQGVRQAWLGGSRKFTELGPKSTLIKMLNAIVPDPTALTTYVIDSHIALNSFVTEEDDEL
ncbi:MAG: ACP S-malonyltransferase [Acidobacteria bacterium]|nr:ACP S-malonyltransferase [Acidobacteriota bacterium]